MSASCSDDGGGGDADLAVELDSHDDLVGWTVELVGVAPPEVLAERAQVIGDGIARTVAALGEPETFHDEFGMSPRQRISALGRVLGGTAAVLRSTGNEIQATEYALALAWSSSGERELDGDERMDWVLPAGTDSEVVSDVAEALTGGDFATAARAVTATGIGADDIVAEVATEVGELAPVTSDEDLLTDLDSAYNLGESITQ